MTPLTDNALIILVVCAYLAGLSKASIGGLGIIMVPLMALAFEAKESTGILLVLLILADIWAVILYRKSANWSIILKILPAVTVGIIIGWLIMPYIDNQFFTRFLGAFIMIMLLLEWRLSTNKAPTPTNGSPEIGRLNRRNFSKFIFHPTSLGILSGFATMVANAAGPLFAIYLLRLNIGKEEFVGSRSWFFFIINLGKLPLSWQLGYIKKDLVLLELCLIPIIIIGTLSGYYLLKKINLGIFQNLIRLMAILSIGVLLAK